MFFVLADRCSCDLIVWADNDRNACGTFFRVNWDFQSILPFLLNGNFPLYDVGKDSMTFLELEIHFVNQNPPLESSVQSSDISDIALVSPFDGLPTIAHMEILTLFTEHFLIIICHALLATISTTQ